MSAGTARRGARERRSSSRPPAKRQPRLQMSTDVVYMDSPSSSSGARYHSVTTLQGDEENTAR